MSSITGRIVALRSFPVKGLSAEALSSVKIEAGRPIAGDRAFAIENGPSGFDPKTPKKIPKIRFLCLMRNARLAGLGTVYNPETGMLTVTRDGVTALEAALTTDEGRAATEAWFTGFMEGELKGPLKVLPAPDGHTFSDTSLGVLSLINHASVVSVEAMAGAPVDPLRFRGNLEVDGFAPWAELGWEGRELVSGAVRMKVMFRTVRCAATEVDPATAERDIKIPKLLQQNLGHADCGVYIEALTSGRLEVGAEIALI